MELPQRKRIRLPDYDYSENGAYFITVCTKDRKQILSEIVGDDAHIVPQVVLSAYGEIAECYIRSVPGIDKYVIMPDHIHMIIKIDGTMWASSPTKDIPQVIKSFKTLVTKSIGFSIFQRQYFDHVIRGQQDYEEIWRYIDENPLRWIMNKQSKRSFENEPNSKI